MNNFKELKVWQKSMDLVVDVYKLTKKYPADERFGLISQSNRCSVSVPSNIAEGAGRRTNKDFARFLGFSSGSSFELETQLILAQKLGYITEEDLNSVSDNIDHIQKMLYKLQESLER
jgi:four helix bundle protein